MGVLEPVELVTDGRVPGIPARVWRLVADPDQLVRWFEFADRLEVLQGEGLGRRQRAHTRRRDRDLETDQVVTEFQPPRLIEWRREVSRLDGEPVDPYARDSRFAIELRPDGDATIVTLRGTQVPSSFWRGQLIRRFGRRETGRLMQKSIANLVALATALDEVAARSAGRPGESESR